MLLEKLRYLSSGADFVVLAGLAAARRRRRTSTRELIRELNRRQVLTVLDAEGEPLRLGLEAEPFLVSPNQREAEALVGQEFYEQQDFALALEHIAELGARNVLITNESGCFARLREGRKTRRYRARRAAGRGRSRRRQRRRPPRRASSPRTLDGRSPEDALRDAVAAGAASTLELGAGRFEPSEARRARRRTSRSAELEPVSV